MLQAQLHATVSCNHCARFVKANLLYVVLVSLLAVFQIHETANNSMFPLIPFKFTKTLFFSDCHRGIAVILIIIQSSFFLFLQIDRIIHCYDQMDTSLVPSLENISCVSLLLAVLQFFNPTSRLISPDRV